jgi:hypothetical protein
MLRKPASMFNIETGFLQSFPKKIQGLFKDFQGPFLKFSRTFRGLFRGRATREHECLA